MKRYIITCLGRENLRACSYILYIYIKQLNHSLLQKAFEVLTMPLSKLILTSIEGQRNGETSGFGYLTIQKQFFIIQDTYKFRHFFGLRYKLAQAEAQSRMLSEGENIVLPKFITADVKIINICLNKNTQFYNTKTLQSVTVTLKTIQRYNYLFMNLHKTHFSLSI